ncbi:MAG: hypothetical protein M3Q07_15630, partial [Pseudobdellovibrionaceae bacterium]|nr:hypothetical protein [Pseudobdellovibrionaceae bacterium]
MRWLPTLLLTLVGFPLNAFGQDQGFDDSILLSNTIIASSQSYQIKKLGCEFAGIFSRGNMESKNGQLTIEAKSEG